MLFPDLLHDCTQAGSFMYILWSKDSGILEIYYTLHGENITTPHYPRSAAYLLLMSYPSCMETGKVPYCTGVEKCYG